MRHSRLAFVPHKAMLHCLMNYIYSVQTKFSRHFVVFASKIKLGRTSGQTSDRDAWTYLKKKKKRKY